MNWFKAMWLTSKEREVLKLAKLRESQPAEQQQTSQPINVNPWKIIYSNKNVTVIFKDGFTLSKSEVDKELLDKVKDAGTKAEIEELLIGKRVPETKAIETKEEIQQVKDNLYVFRNHKDFIVTGDKLYLKGVNLAIPSPVVFSFIELIEKMSVSKDRYLADKYRALKMFWLKLAYNSIEQSRNDLISFVKANDVQISGNGNLILYRRIESSDKQVDKTLTKFVSTVYFERKKQKKSTTHPRNYVVVKGPKGFEIVKENTLNSKDPNIVGNLERLYKGLDTLEENSFHSHWSGKDGQLPIKIGAIYKIPETDINLNNGVCAAGGLHAANVNYDYSGYGDMPVVVLVNPSKAITVPVNDMGKIRTTEMFVACVNDKPRGTHFDEDGLSMFDDEYHDLSIKELEDALSTRNFNPICIQKEVPAISLIDLNNITKMLKQRVEEVV